MCEIDRFQPCLPVSTIGNEYNSGQHEGKKSGNDFFYHSIRMELSIDSLQNLW